MAKQKPTSYHVAKLAGVSQTTVSFVMNNRFDISIPQKTRDTVIAAARQLGYRPNRAASALASGTTNSVSFWLTSLSAPVYLNWIKHMQLEATSKGYSLSLSEKGHTPEQGTEASYISEWPVDGIFAYSLQWLPRYLETHIVHSPIVLMGYYMAPEVERYDRVVLDLYTPTVETMQYLISTGRKQIAYFQAPLTQTTKPPRFRAYEDTMHSAGLVTECLTTPELSRASAYESLKAYAEQRGLPDALLCHNDDYAIAALRVARELGLRVPDDLAIAGSDGLEDTEYHEPRISTIELPYAKMCETAWEFMEHRIENPTASPQCATFPGRLLMRESTMLPKETEE